MSDEEMAQAWAKHYPKHRAEKVSEHVCRLICLCIGYRVSGEISGGDTDPVISKLCPQHEIATAICRRFPELAPRLPRFRKRWMSEDYRMNIFDAVALGISSQRANL